MAEVVVQSLHDDILLFWKTTRLYSGCFKLHLSQQFNPQDLKKSIQSFIKQTKSFFSLTEWINWLTIRLRNSLYNLIYVNIISRAVKFIVFDVLLMSVFDPTGTGWGNSIPAFINLGATFLRARDPLDGATTSVLNWIATTMQTVYRYNYSEIIEVEPMSLGRCLQGPPPPPSHEAEAELKYKTNELPGMFPISAYHVNDPMSAPQQRHQQSWWDWIVGNELPESLPSSSTTDEKDIFYSAESQIKSVSTP